MKEIRHGSIFWIVDVCFHVVKMRMQLHLQYHQRLQLSDPVCQEKLDKQKKSHKKLNLK